MLACMHDETAQVPSHMDANRHKHEFLPGKAMALHTQVNAGARVDNEGGACSRCVRCIGVV
jgi:hypothetical protein